MGSISKNYSEEELEKIPRWIELKSIRKSLEKVHPIMLAILTDIFTQTFFSAIECIIAQSNSETKLQHLYI